jgi:ABC-type phosphate/phosphonate transport system permease subunit
MPLTDEQAMLLEQSPGGGDQPWVVVEPTCGEFAENVREGTNVRQEPGTPLTVRGGGMRPNEQVQIWWRSPGGSEPFRPQLPGGPPNTMADDEGNFEISFTAPPFSTPAYARGIQLHFVQARQIRSIGAPEPSPDLKNALDRIVITIFQALMGTTFGIVMAIPLSFFAARNLVLMEGSPVRWGGIFTLLFVPLEVALLIRLGASSPINPTLVLLGTLGALIAAGLLMFGIVSALGALVSRTVVNRILDATGILFYYIVRGILNVTRSIEPIIWAVIAAAWVGLGPFAGVIALTLHTVASLAKLYSEAIESIDPGPLEAIQATGATWLQMVVYAVIPQLIPPFLSFTIYRWDINVRMSTIIGFVGGGGIGQLLFQWIGKTD